MWSRPTIVEIFDRKFNFIDKAVITFPKYEFDYISIGETTITVPEIITANKTDYIIATQENIKIQAIITSVEYTDSSTKIKYKPLLQLTDIDIYFDTNRQKIWHRKKL